MICEGKVIVLAIVSTGLPSAFQSHANSLRLQHICLHHKTTNEYKWGSHNEHQNLGHQIKDALKAIRNPVNPLDVCTRWNPLNIQAWSRVFVGHVEATVSLQLLVCPATWCAGYRYHVPGYLFVCPPALAVCLVVCPWSGVVVSGLLFFCFSACLSGLVEACQCPCPQRVMLLSRFSFKATVARNA